MDIYNGNKLNRSMVWQTLYDPSLSFGRQIVMFYFNIAYLRIHQPLDLPLGRNAG